MPITRAMEEQLDQLRQQYDTQLQQLTTRLAGLESENTTPPPAPAPAPASASASGGNYKYPQPAVFGGSTDTAKAQAFQQHCLH